MSIILAAATVAATTSPVASEKTTVTCEPTYVGITGVIDDIHPLPLAVTSDGTAVLRLTGANLTITVQPVPDLAFTRALREHPTLWAGTTDQMEYAEATIYDNATMLVL